jgi:hypothetical protein
MFDKLNKISKISKISPAYISNIELSLFKNFQYLKIINDSNKKYKFKNPDKIDNSQSKQTQNNTISLNNRTKCK